MRAAFLFTMLFLFMLTNFTPLTTSSDIPILKQNFFYKNETAVALKFDYAGSKSLNFSVPKHAFILNASLSVRGLAHPNNPLSYPLSPSIDLFDDGLIDWQFSGKGYGEFGHQFLFYDNASSYNLSFGADDYKTINFLIPKNATLKNASISAGGYPVPFWGKEYPVASPPHSEGEYNPAMAVYDDKLYVMWTTLNSTITGDNNKDVLFRVFDGKNWSDITEITDKNDSTNDYGVVLIPFKGKIYALWISGDFLLGKDSAILMKEFDGKNWGQRWQVSFSPTSGINTNPCTAIYKDKLYIFWTTTDNRVANVENEEDMDIVYRWFDGVALSEIREISSNTNNKFDWAPISVVYDEKIYVAWETDITTEPGYNYADILIRSYDGIVWSEILNLAPVGDSIEQVDDSLPSIIPYKNPANKIEELYVFWARGQLKYSGGIGADIVYRKYSKEEGWSEMIYISKKEDGEEDCFVSLIIYENRLYIIWVTGINTTKVGELENIVFIVSYGDIVIKCFDGYGWSETTELTPLRGYDNATHPDLRIYNNKLYAAWECYNLNRDEWSIVLRNIDIKPIKLSIDAGDDGTDWTTNDLSHEKIDILDGIKNAIAHLKPQKDDYGNEYYIVPLKIGSAYPCNVNITELSIIYDSKFFLSNFSAKLNSFLDKFNSSDGNISVEIRATSLSKGTLEIGDLNIEYFLNFAPFLLKPIPELFLNEDEPTYKLIDLEEYFSDDWDDGNLLFHIVYLEDEKKVNSELNGSYMNFFLPTENWYGKMRFRVRATDRFNLWYESDFFNVTVRPVNDNPVLSEIEKQFLVVGKHYKKELMDYASDVDNDKLNFSSNSTIFNITSDGVIDFTPKEVGHYLINISVSDGNGGFAWQEVEFFILPVDVSTETCCGLHLLILIIASLVIFGIWLYYLKRAKTRTK
ncbi:MAG: Ig-like domain-containing protein [Candidatus Thermoplasmatota archaeon]